MDIKKKYAFYNKVATCLALIMLLETALPTVTLALTSGPANPEFSSFEPVSTTSMVNEFSGSFTYNIPVLEVPGANGGGYACGLSYHSGESVESEASWVGYGWSLNPGAINRSKRGFADDSNGDEIKYFNDVPANWTVSLGANAGQIEAFSVDLPVNVGASVRYNNYKGFGYSVNAGYNVGIVSLGYSLSDGDGSFSVNVNPAGLLSKVNKDQKLDDLKKDVKAAKTGADRKKALEAIGEYKKDGGTGDKTETKKGAGAVGFLSNMGSAYGMHAIGSDLRATSATPYSGVSVNMQVKVDAELLPVPVGTDMGFNANYSRQQNEKSRTVNTYGYMYSNEALGNPQSMMDYYLEKEATYNKRDYYLSIPFSNADMYGLSGEGLGGGFRLYNKNTGTFFPNEVESNTNIVQAGAAVELGLDIGVGADLGVGFQTLKVKRKWSDDIGGESNGNTGDYVFANSNSDEPVFFRFNNDLGGSLSYTDQSSATKAGINYQSGEVGFRKFEPIVQNNIRTSLIDTVENGSNRSGRSSYIAYHTNSEMLQQSANAKYYNRYDRSTSTNNLVNRQAQPNGIGEFAVFNEDGNRYVYGLPVYSKNEVNMQYDLRGVKGSDIHNNHIAYKDILNPFSRVGEMADKPYATSYLLTEITSPDYLDRTLDGPTADDFGGYTKFIYNKPYGGSGNNWYKWRIPYTGLSYNPRDLTDNLDDMGSVNSGEKEICYLDKIETKTHLAVFVTNKTDFYLGSKHIQGSLLDRQDALEAEDDITAAKSATAKGARKLQMLERIELYAKPVDGSSEYKLIKTTHFEYDYSLCGYVPNNLGGNVGDVNINANKGKLTLKKVWFEHEDIHNVKISPYKFDYLYPTLTTGNGIPSDYAPIVNHSSGLTPELQNPNYNPLLLDRWGNVCAPDADIRHQNMNPWVDQTPSNFDPAAWQLKKITLPSGGEILVQYEQNEYSYVQDRRVLTMVSLKRVGTFDTYKNTFYLNIENDLGITSTPEKEQLAALIREEFKNKKMYFKYLYALVGGNAQLGSCNSDYVDGYVNLKEVGVDGDGLYITLGDENYFDGNSYLLPRNVCIDYVKHEKAGKLKPFNNCNAKEGGLDDKNGALDVAQQLLSWVASAGLPQSTCIDLNESLSYLRIPMLKAKKGGGIRVKRILMHDKGIETGDEAIYGSEYSYTETDGGSSGVATNEPSAGKEENALVTDLVKRSKQGIINRLTSGKDKEQSEGPLGEYLLPAPSVGYSRVVVKNIHSGRTNTGMIVHEFYTVKDYPFDKWYNTSEVKGPAIDHTPIEEERDYLPIPAPYFSSVTDNLWLSQGYRFVINEMHGQQKSMSTYGGETVNGLPDASMLSSKQEFSYFEPGEKIPLMVDADGTVRYGNPGKETEVVMERRAVEDVCKNGRVEGDFSVGLLPPIFPTFVSASGSASYTESKLRTHVTSKIIRYPAIQKSVTSFQDGIYHLNENIAFSPSTGKPMLTKTSDGYDKLDLQQDSPNGSHDGSYYTYAVSASSQYKEMGQKATNERRKVKSDSKLQLSLVKEGFFFYLKFEVPAGAPSGTTVCDAMNVFVKGDLICVNKDNIGNKDGLYHTYEKDGSKIILLPAYAFNPNINQLPTGSLTDVEIIRSGKTNQLSTNVGSYTTYGSKQNVNVTTFNDGTEMTSRKQISNSLNYVLASNYSGTIGFGSLNNSVSYDIGVPCNPINDSNHPFSIQYSGNTFTIKILKRAAFVETLPTPKSDIDGVYKLANDLNKYSNKVWASDGAQCDNLFWESYDLNFNKNNYVLYSSNITSLVNACTSPLHTNINTNAQSGLYGSSVEKVEFFKNPAYVAILKMQAEGLSRTRRLLGIKNDVAGVKYCDFNISIKRTNGPTGTFAVRYSNYSKPKFWSEASYSSFIQHPIYKQSDFKDMNTWTSPGNTYNYISNNTFNVGCGIFKADNEGYLYFDYLNGKKVMLLAPLPKQTINHPAEYYSHTFTKGGNFGIDETTGQLVYFDPTNPCYPQKVNFNFCVPASGVPALKTFNNVIACNANTFTDNWPYYADLNVQGSFIGNGYETGVLGKWRMNSSYVYNEAITGGSKTNERNYNDAGTYTMELFNWKNESANGSKWIRANTVTRYSLNGDAIEENDVLNVKSTAKYGYKGMLPYMIAKNASYSSVYFESFENVYPTNKLEECLFRNQASIDNALAHSGKNSLKLTNNTGQLEFKFTTTTQMKLKGLSVKAWVKTAEKTDNPIEVVFSGSATKSFLFKKIAQTGNWTLYEAFVKGTDLVAYTGTTTVSIRSKTSNACWLDDVRIQPADAQVMTYVYDTKTMRLVASFDDQHFGLYYQYNAEGKLVRKLVETERGVKTIQETQYHTPLTMRNN